MEDKFTLKNWIINEIDYYKNIDGPENKSVYILMSDILSHYGDNNRKEFLAAISFLYTLANMNPLLPIENTDDNWSKHHETAYGVGYVCKRKPSLMKFVRNDGEVTVTDFNRYIFIDCINNTMYRGRENIEQTIMDTAFKDSMFYEFPYSNPFPIEVKVQLLPDAIRILSYRKYGEDEQNFEDVCFSIKNNILEEPISITDFNNRMKDYISSKNNTIA